MAKKTKTATEVIELEEINIILKIPKEAVALEVTASIIRDDKLVKVSKELAVSDIHTMRQDFLENVELGDDYDGKFVLTEEGRKFLKELAAKGEQE